MLSSPRKPPSKTLCPPESFLFTHLDRQLLSAEPSENEATNHVKLSNNFWNTRSKKGISSRPVSLRSILKTLNVALKSVKSRCLNKFNGNCTHQACTGGFTSEKFHSYAGICPSGLMYHSLVNKSSCFLAKVGSTTARGMQWKAVSQAAKNGYSHLNKSSVGFKTDGFYVVRTCRAWKEYRRRAYDANPNKLVSAD